MIKIIKPGTRRIMICDKCGCEFSFEKEEVLEKCLDGYKHYAEYIICPQCHKQHTVRDNTVRDIK